LDSARHQLTTASSKITDLKGKIDFERNRREESHSELEKQVHAFGRQREAHEAEVQELRWAVVRSSDRNSEL
jgi:predicted  nucleic acid-binding Zn-ribbon protein